ALLFYFKFFYLPYSLYKLNLLSVSCNICFIASSISLLSAIGFLSINGISTNILYSVLLGSPIRNFTSFFLELAKIDINKEWINLLFPVPAVPATITLPI